MELCAIRFIKINITCKFDGSEQVGPQVSNRCPLCYVFLVACLHETRPITKTVIDRNASYSTTFKMNITSINNLSVKTEHNLDAHFAHFDQF